MRNVKRVKTPMSLKKHSSKWTKELLDEIARCSTIGEKVSDSFFDKYRTDSVKKSLDKMYNNFCCYCEFPVGVVDYPHIEHLKPKRQKNGVPPIPFPELTYDWTNLHLACGKCNIKKGTKHDDVNPILDPVQDNKIFMNFQYDAGVGAVWWTPLTPRAETTEAHVGLNRKRLLESRHDLWSEVTNTITNLNRTASGRKKEIAVIELKKKQKGVYGSMVKYLVDTLLQ